MSVGLSRAEAEARVHTDARDRLVAGLGLRRLRPSSRSAMPG